MAAFMLHVLKINLIAAVMICTAKVLSCFTKRKYSSRWKYYLWLMVMVFLLIPVDFSAGNLLKVQIHRLETEDENFVETVQVSGGSARRTESEQEAAGISIENGKSEGLLPGRNVSLYEGLTAFGAIWLAGIFVLGSIRALRYYFSLHSMMRWSYAIRSKRVLRIYAAQCSKKGIRHPPRLLMCEGLSSPMLAGIRRAGLYLPENAYKSEELEFIFSHELSHYCRHDLWYKMLIIVVTTIYWFNPALYFMQQEAEKDIENLCDGSMVVQYSMDKRMKYGRLLLKIAASQNHVPYLSVSLNDSKEVFKDRILYMKNLKFLRERVSLAVLLGGIMAASHMLVGISIESIPVYAKEREDFAKAEEELQKGELVSMTPISEDQDLKLQREDQDTAEAAENQESEEIKEIEPEKSETENAEPENEEPGIAAAGNGSQDLAGAEASAAENEPDGSGDVQETSGAEDTQGETAMTGEMMCVWAADWDGATYLYEGTDGNWYDIYGNQFYGNGGGSWTDPDGSVYYDYDPNAASPDDAAVQANIADDSGYNVGTLYQDEEGVWMNGAGGVFTDNGDGTFTGPDGNIWYEQ